MDASDEPLSSQVNGAVRNDLEERRRRRYLREFPHDARAVPPIQASLEAASRRDHQVLVPAVILADLYRSPSHTDLADAHVIATAVEAGGGVVLTGDPDDLERLAGGHPGLVVQPV